MLAELIWPRYLWHKRMTVSQLSEKIARAPNPLPSHLDSTDLKYSHGALSITGEIGGFLLHTNLDTNLDTNGSNAKGFARAPNLETNTIY